jgi:PAS domain S-box-containing protein
VSEDNNRLLLEAILRNSSAGVLAYEAIRNTAGSIDDFRFILINPAAEWLSGLSAATDIGRRLLEFDPAARNNGLFEKFVAIVQTGEPLEFEHYSQLAEPRWYRISGSKLGDGLTVSYMDISEQKQHEETLRLNEERFRQILDGVEDYALFMLGPDGTILSWNSGAERLKGYAADEIIGRHFSCFFTPAARTSAHPDNELRIAAQAGRYHEEGWRVRKDGSQFLADVVLTAVRDRTGALRGFAKATRDITAARNRDKAIQEQAHILDLASDTIVVRDLDDRIIYWNRGAQHLYGYTKQEAIGEVTHQLLKTGFPQPPQTIMARLMQEGHWEGELTHVRRDGSLLSVASRWTVQKASADSPARIIEMNHDITESKRMELELREKNAELQRAAHAKDDFLAKMSHELRTPLNGIIGFSELLVDGLPGAINPEQAEYLTDILGSAHHLLQLINDILDLSKVEAGKMPLHPQVFSMPRVVEQICTVIRPLAQRKCIQLSSNLAPELDEIELDQQRFKQILFNLLSNAVKFTNDGGSVVIAATPLGRERFALSVRDTGIGIEPQNLQRLFEEFEQLDAGTTRRYEGTGLGLALTRNLVQMQGGSIRAESEFGKGATFTVTLPLRPAEAST